MIFQRHVPLQQAPTFRVKSGNNLTDGKETYRRSFVFPFELNYFFFRRRTHVITGTGELNGGKEQPGTKPLHHF